MSGVFQGRSLLVIGASSGIGAELTRQLLDQGAHVIAWGVATRAMSRLCPV